MLLADPLPWEALDQLPAPQGLAGGPPPVWLALDEVQDPVRSVKLTFYVSCIANYCPQGSRCGLEFTIASPIAQARAAEAPPEP